MKFYRLRARIVIEAQPDLEIGVAPEKPDGLMAYADPRSAQIGWRIIAKAGTLPVGTGYETARIVLGLADSDGDIGSSQLFPHEANFDLLGAVSFTKGLRCRPGGCVAHAAPLHGAQPHSASPV